MRIPLFRNPPGYVTFHGALNAFGRLRLPDQWNATPSWRLVPFFKRNGQYGRHVFKAGKYEWEKVKLPKGENAQAQHAQKIFLQAAGDFIELLREQTITAYVISDGDKPAEVKKGSLRWHVQRERILCDGFMRWAPDETAGRRHRIIISSKEFEKWCPPRKPRSTKQFQEADAALIVDLQTILTEHASGHEGYKYPLSTLWNELRADLAKVLKQATFKRLIFAPPNGPSRRSGPGSPTDDIEAAFFNDNITSIKLGVRSAVARFERRNEDEE